MSSIPETDIARVARELGCGRLQALRHLQGRKAAIEALARKRRAAIRLEIVAGSYVHAEPNQ